MADIIEEAKKFRAAARKRDSAARALVASQYAAALRDIDRDARAMIRVVEDQRRQGLEVSEDSIKSLRQYGATRKRTEAGLLSASKRGVAVASKSTKAAVKEAEGNANRLLALKAEGKGPDIYDATSVENLTGLLDRGPLQARIIELAGKDADAVMGHISNGLIRQRPVAQTLQRIHATVQNSSEWHLKTIVTTETNRARREGMRVVMERSPYVTGYRWVCSLTDRSCGFCWSQHGKWFPTSRVMATHPNCSCTMIPSNQDDETDSGVDLFEALTPAEQDKAFGSASMGRAFRDGAFELGDVAKVGRHEKWGPTGAQRSLKSLVNSEDATRYKQSPK